MKVKCLLIGLLVLFISQGAFSHPLFGEDIYIASKKTGKFLCPVKPVMIGGAPHNTGSVNKYVTTTGDAAEKHCVFKFVQIGDDIKIWSKAKRQFLSGDHYSGYKLKTEVRDEAWTRFKINSHDDGTITIQTKHPAADSKYVTQYGVWMHLLIAEISPTIWSYFIVYKASDMSTP